MEEAYADAVAADARRRAAGRPTPQARMASTALVRRGSELLVSSAAVVSGRGGSTFAGGIAGGSEYGSALYPQFGPRRAGGSWLRPAGETPTEATLSVGDRALDRLIEDVI